LDGEAGHLPNRFFQHWFLLIDEGVNVPEEARITCNGVPRQALTRRRYRLAIILALVTVSILMDLIS
jgi:hypothetical protein